MNGFRLKRPMCRRDPKDVSDEDRTSKMERMPSGERVRVTRFSDGTTTVHHGGPVGDAYYDDLGEEC